MFVSSSIIASPIFANFACYNYTAVARSFSGGVTTYEVTVRYTVFPVLWLTLHLHIMAHIGISIPLQRVTSVRGCALANVPAASQLIASRPRRRRALRLDESIVQGVPGRNLQCTIALLGLGFTVIRLLFRVAVGVIGLG